MFVDYDWVTGHVSRFTRLLIADTRLWYWQATFGVLFALTIGTYACLVFSGRGVLIALGTSICLTLVAGAIVVAVAFESRRRLLSLQDRIFCQDDLAFELVFSPSVVRRWWRAKQEIDDLLLLLRAGQLQRLDKDPTDQFAEAWFLEPGFEAERAEVWRLLLIIGSRDKCDCADELTRHYSRVTGRVSACISDALLTQITLEEASIEAKRRRRNHHIGRQAHANT